MSSIFPLFAQQVTNASPDISGWTLAIIGAGVVFILLALMFMVRQVLAVFFNFLLLLLGALLVIAGIFGGPLGIYDALFGEGAAHPIVPSVSPEGDSLLRK